MKDVDNENYRLGTRPKAGRLVGAPGRRLHSPDAALGVKLLNVSLAELAVPQRVVPLQLRPDDREPTRCTILTFTIRGIPFHDLSGQMREMFEQSKTAFGEWRFGDRKVPLEPIVLGLPGVLNDVPLQTAPTVWQRPGLDAEWEQEAELWVKLRNFKWMEELKSNLHHFERRLIALRGAVASTMKVKDPRVLQVARYYTSSDGTIVIMTPATPDKQEHTEQLKKWLLALERGELTKKIPELAEDFWPIRCSKTGRPLRISTLDTSTSSSTAAPPAYRVVVDRDDYSYEFPKASFGVDRDITPPAKPFSVMGIFIAVALLVILLGLIGLCIFYYSRRSKARPRSSKRLDGGCIPLAAAAKAKANRKDCAATNKGGPQQTRGKASTSPTKRKGYAGS